MRGLLSMRLCVALVFLGCAPSATQLIVVVDTDLGVPNDLDRLTIAVRREGSLVESEEGLLSSRDELPRTLTVIPLSEDSLGPIVVEASGYDGATLVVSRAAEVTLVRGETRVLSLFLLSSCRGVTCRTTESCGERGCVPRADVPLYPWTGELPRIGMDAGAIDAGMRDVGVRPDTPGVDAGPACVDGDCDDGIACTLDSCDPDVGCQHTGRDAQCDDMNPCTVDSCGTAGCVHTPAPGASCDDGMFCNGMDTCGMDGACSTHGGDPCPGGACLEASDTCDILCPDRAGCPADTFGAYSSCDYADGCDESASRTRTARRWTCDGTMHCAFTDTTETDTAGCARSTTGTMCGSGTCGAWTCGGFSDGCDESGTESRTCTDVVCTSGSCGAVMRTEDRGCTRDTDGAMCNMPTCGAWGACGGFADACDTSGTRSRTCSDYACAAGGCAATMRMETESCTRSTDGTSCGSTTCGGWSGCGYASTCDEDATETRTCTDYVCAAGTCGAPTRTESRGCTRDTDGTNCGATTCGAWSTCTYSSFCDTTGTATRTCTDYVCVAGSCPGATRTETDNACSTRVTEGMDCGSPDDCTTDRCTSGTCVSSGGCTGGRRCCYPGCFTICP